jgi:methylmalonyl-CoA/ethylmalonyl-CoA epimerase
LQKDWKFIHVNMVVKDINETVKQFEALGVGPFQTPPPGRQRTNQTVRGKPVEYDYLARSARAEAGMGGIALELMQPLPGKGKSTYNEFLEEKGEGVHHLAFAVPDLEAEIADLEKRGFKVVQTGGYGGKVGFVYVDAQKAGGLFLELVQLPPQK